MAEESNKKRKRDYHLMLFIDNENGEITQMGIGRAFIEALAGIILAIIIICIIGWGINSSKKKDFAAQNSELTTQVETLQAQLDEQVQTNKSLEEKITILSNTVNSKVEQETALLAEDEAAHLPEGFPLSASASMITDESDPTTVLFTCASGANIISAGAGTVCEVVPNADYGYCVRVDHDNGYITEYYNSSMPVVREGDTVIEGSILYVVEEGSDKMIYKVSLDGEYIDPMSIIKIDG